MAQFKDYAIVNRGNEETPFGFVYLGEDKRAYFAIDRDKGTLELGGPGSGYWRHFTRVELGEAMLVLADRFAFALV